MLLGYGLRRGRVLKTNDVEVVNNIVIYLTFPALIFVSIHGKTIMPDMYKATALCIAAELLVMGLAYAIGRLMKLDRCTIAGMMLAAAFGNTGFMGYPVVSAAFDGRNRAMLSAVILDEFGMNLILVTLGVAIAMRVARLKGDGGGLLGMLKQPPFAATVAALCLRRVDMPPTVMKTLGYLAAGRSLWQ